MVELNNYERYYEKRVLRESKERALNDKNSINDAVRRESLFFLWAATILFITMSFGYFFTSGVVSGFLIWTIHDISKLQKKKKEAERWLRANS